MRNIPPFPKKIPFFAVLLVAMACIIGTVSGDGEGASPPETLAPAEMVANTTLPLEMETPPDAALVLSITADPPGGPVPLTVRFTGAATGLTVDLWNWTVDGVAAIGNGSDFTHTFLQPGTHTVALTARNTTVPLAKTAAIEAVAEEIPPLMMTAPVVVLADPLPGTHPRDWYVSPVPGTGNPHAYENVTGLLNITDIGAGDTIHIWGVEGYTYEGGVVIDVPDVTVKRWEGSPVQPLVTNRSGMSAFTVVADNATFRGLNISDNQLNDKDGAGIYATGTGPGTPLERLSIIDCTFVGNDAPYGGGAYFEFCDAATLTKTSFIGNSARFGGGGAYFALSSDATITATTFTGNSATNGGGVYFYSSRRATLTDTEFTGNSATEHGGGAWFYDSNAATITSTTFARNTATDHGGGVYFETCRAATLTNCRFDNPTNIYAEMSFGATLNAARTRGTNIAGGPYLGGNVWLNDPAQNISGWGTDDDFDGICDQPLNITNREDPDYLFGTDSLPLIHGGGTVQVAATPTDDAFVYIDGANTTRTANDAFYLPVGDRTVSVRKDGYLPGEKRISVTPGANAPLAFALIEIKHPMDWYVSPMPGNGNFTNISAIPDLGAGDTIHIWGVEGHAYEGGVVIDKPHVMVKRWEGSPAQPLVTNTSHTAPAFTVVADNATFRGLNISGNRLNNDTSSGAGINATGSETDRLKHLTIADCTFSGNKVNGTDAAGGALSATYVNDLLVERTAFTGNNATRYGGGAQFMYCNDSVLTDTTFTDNAARFGGGVQFLFCNGSALTDTTVTGNRASSCGGGADFLYSRGPVTITDSTFNDNAAASQGGGSRFYIADGSCATLTNTTLTGNSAFLGGGAYFQGPNRVMLPTAVLAGSTFTNNTAERGGGGAYFVDCDEAMLTDLSFTGNSADYGGGADFYQCDDVTLNTSAFAGNRAAHAGGAVNVSGFLRSYRVPIQHFTIADCTFAGNAADVSGGALSARAVDNLSVERTTFTGNDAPDGGGTYVSWCNDTFVADCRFENPTNIHAENSTGVLNAARTIGTNIAGGPYLGGNLWLNDPAQNISESGTDADFDGICDESLEIPNLGTDYLPLVYGGTVGIASTPAGASVHLDGVMIGRTTDTSLYLPVGDHMVTITLDGYVTPAQRVVTVVPGETVPVAFALEPVSSPSGSGGGHSDISAASAGKIPPGGNASLTFSGPAIYEIRVTAATEIPNLLVTIGRTGLLSGVDAPAGLVFEYDEVTIYHTTDDAIEGTLIFFSIPKAWLEENSLDPADVVLYRYHDGAWQALPTEVIGEDATFWYFSARSPGFSLFAIGGDPAPVAVETPDAGAQAGTTEPIPPVTTVETTSPPTETSQPFPSVLVLVCGAAAALIIAAVVLRKRR
ncbi:right-handed parallel beta-helix repeat-containing protein [Methanofollis ethanolicus]|uniref:right-handed parallel beta-helix repeat-containing protein n=1 Tax=Methanofollis ethanolicus TaxID=488124 RepID=UPI00082DAFBA|nr:right-handed parallel beta-helix repeat-containing protein [Methanofollis ethanolicus]